MAVASSASLEVRLLGRVEAIVDGEPVELPGRRPRALLAVLALSAGESVPAESLYERVWGHDQAGDVRASLYTCVSRLRRALGDDAIGTESGRYQLRVEPERVDAVHFGRLLDRAGRRGTDPEPLLREALGLWLGEPFGGEPLSDWLAEHESRRLTERWLAAVQQRTDFDLAAGRHGELVAELEQLTAAYPLREPLWARYLLALDGSGRPADALAAYERVRVRLVDELGIDPSPELQSLYAGLLRGERLTVTAAGPALAVPRQLPPDAGTVTGRGDALTELDGLLDKLPDEASRSQVVLGVLHGMGGVGKTTVAVHWAHRVSDRFPDGQLFVNLRGYGPGEPMEPAAALDLLLRGIGVPGYRIPGGVDARAGLWRSSVSAKRVLVLLDNARDAEQVRPLLPGAGCMVLVTSRAQLGGLAARDGAHRVRLDVLPEREATSLLRSRLVTDSVDESAVAELAALCGRLPLALTVAAERANQYADRPLAELTAELRDERQRLDAFADPDDALADVRAVLSWSVDALDADTARLFRLLGLAPGADISVDAVAALAGEPPAVARRLLHRLTDANLATATAEGRFQIHDLVRAYAAEAVKLEPAGVQREALRRFYQWCLRTATNAERVFSPHMSILHPDDEVPGVPDTDFGSDQAAVVAWFDEETDFLLAIAEAAVQSHPWVTVGIAHALWDEIRWNRPWEEALDLHHLATHAAQTLGSDLAEARTLNTLGLAYLGGQAPDEAVNAFEQALALFEKLTEVAWQSRVLNNLGMASGDCGQPMAALDYYRRALALKLQLGDLRGEANVRNNLAYDLTDLSLHDSAIAEARQAVALYRHAGSPIDQAKGLDTVGAALLASGDGQAALDCFVEALELGRDRILARPHAIILTNLARSQRAVGRTAEARFTLRSAIAFIDEHAISDTRDLRRADLVELLASVPGDPTRREDARVDR
ncbi:AfsR/SARP family transcriptional regulator [Nocardioides speluncae]|uniref:AfsR/SARP family transcriptional regulator n=1 Tax=Nocardioides speluncae TaxID=2670337 RepID=UPI000D68618A|nr:BTAD domain-containing putative transcriptional regulator [Nocardioides speluncae]